MKSIALVLAVLPLVLSGCATTQQYLPIAGSENLSPGNALIKVERKDEILGSGRSLEISDDGRVVGQVSPGKHLIWQRPAGDFVLQIVPAALMVSKPTPLKIHAEAGKQYNFLVFWGGTTFKLEKQ